MGFRSEQQQVPGLETRPVQTAFRVTTQGEYPGEGQGFPQRCQGGMDADVRIFVVIEPGAAQSSVVESEAERCDEVQARAGRGAKPYNVARIGRDLRLE